MRASIESDILQIVNENGPTPENMYKNQNRIEAEDRTENIRRYRVIIIL